jgi:hypothetical protein
LGQLHHPDAVQLDGAAVGAVENFTRGHLTYFGWTGRRDHDDAELAAVQALRARLGRIWDSADDEERAVAQVNALLSDTHASPWLTRHPEQPDGTCTSSRSTTRWPSGWVRRWPWRWPT